ncbi:hypothetical protein TNIN_34851, partial [Trichonephila inaurata madagascariensis]
DSYLNLVRGVWSGHSGSIHGDKARSFLTNSSILSPLIPSCIGLPSHLTQGQTAARFVSWYS